MAKQKYTQQHVIDALTHANGIKAAAARMLGCDYQTVENYCKRYPAVQAAHDKATAVVLDIAEGHLIAAVKRGEWDQIKYYLNAKGKQRGYGVDKRHVEHSGTIDVTQLSDAELDAIIAGQSLSGT